MKHRFLASVFLVFSVVIISFPLRALCNDKTIGLVEELEGLPPDARIAYLKHLVSQGRDEADVYFQIAISYHGTGRVDSAITYYDLTINRDPQHFKAFVNLGVLYDDQGNILEAEKNFRLAVSVNPDDVLANSHLAFMVFQRKDYRNAWRYLSSALTAGPDHPQPHFYLAIFFWENRMYREALVEWKTVTELDPESYLGKKARENIVMLQKALNAPSPVGRWKPER